MNLITTNEQLNALLPNIAVTVQGEVPLIDKMAPFLGATEKWVCDVFTSQPVFDTICQYAEDNDLRAATTQLIVYEAFRRALPHLDVILTPNGFGIVSNTNIAPASKERITRLLDTLLDNRDAAILQVLSLLPAETDWLSTEQAQFFADTLFPNIDVTNSFPRTDRGKWEQYLDLRQTLIPIEEHIATQYMSHPLMSLLRAQAQSCQFSTDKHRHVCRVLKAVEVNCLKESNAWSSESRQAGLNGRVASGEGEGKANHSAAMHKVHRTLTQLVELIRSNPEDFPEWHSSDTAQLYNPPVFENKKESQGYWF